jgi:signal transduction histidine kinase
MSAKQFRSRFLKLILLTWIAPAVFGLSFLVYIQMFSLEQMLDILASPIEPVFVGAAVLFTLWYFNRYAKTIYNYLDNPTHNNAGPLLGKLRAFPLHYWSLFLAYLILAPITVIYSAELFSDFKATPIDWFRISLVALIVSIIVGLPIFFMILDLFGRIMGRIALKQAHITIKVKVFLIGALVPLLIDTILVQYYWTRTAYFTFETFVVWLSLEILAIGGSLIFVKSFGQSLMPLKRALQQSTTVEQISFQDMAPQSTDELGVLTTNYRELLENLKAYHEHLEDLVEHRTTELETSNKELESFCYSVSHDLRAPLRAIRGFSQMILEDYHDKLDDEGRDYLRRISGGIKKMTQLIDDLMALSQVTTHEVQRQQVNLTHLAKDAVAILKESDPDRLVNIEIEEDLFTMGDGKLLKVALDNLFNNAWKYTGKRSNAHIRFGYSPQKQAFYITDNGVGFDMKYADKLFGAFQRLHNVNEFEGTGVGLTTVQRVFERHNGKIWAEAEEGKGATFYFVTQPAKPPASQHSLQSSGKPTIH